MPLSRYNQAFGDKPEAARKALSSMIARYGPEKGKSVFYATVNKRVSRSDLQKLRKRRS